MQLAGLYVGQFLFRESFSERKKKNSQRGNKRITERLILSAQVPCLVKETQITCRAVAGKENHLDTDKPLLSDTSTVNVAPAKPEFI